MAGEEREMVSATAEVKANQSFGVAQDCTERVERTNRVLFFQGKRETEGVLPPRGFFYL